MTSSGIDLEVAPVPVRPATGVSPKDLCVTQAGTRSGQTPAGTPEGGTDTSTGSESLDQLLDEARHATPVGRIEYRDPVAAYGSVAVVALRPLLADPVMRSFAIRALERIALQGHKVEAVDALRSCRPTPRVHPQGCRRSPWSSGSGPASEHSSQADWRPRPRSTIGCTGSW